MDNQPKMAEEDEDPVVCPTCNGSGAIDCSWCGGTGEGPREGTLCGRCRAQGEFPCPDCYETPDPVDWGED